MDGVCLFGMIFHIHQGKPQTAIQVGVCLSIVFFFVIPLHQFHSTSGDVADDAYHRFQEDIELLKRMGVNSYRLSISWTRILPLGTGEINLKGVDYYNRVINSLVEANIIPFVTLFHWDTPLTLEKDNGGWLNPNIEYAFVEFADACFYHFGDRVSQWLTLNEPMTVALNGYSDGVHAPGRCSDRSRCSEGDSASEPYIVAHNMLNAHAAAVQLYRKKYQPKQRGVIGITLNSDFGYPLSPSADDSAAAQRFVLAHEYISNIIYINVQYIWILYYRILYVHVQ